MSGLAPIRGESMGVGVVRQLGLELSEGVAKITLFQHERRPRPDGSLYNL
jgi:hypothetical protein